MKEKYKKLINEEKFLKMKIRLLYLIKSTVILT